MKAEDLNLATIGDLPISYNLISCTPTEPISAVLSNLRKHNIGAIVILSDDGKPSGIFTERDFLLRVARENENINWDAPISQYMTPNPKSAALNSKLRPIFALIRLGKFRHVVIVDENEKAIGMLSIKDAFNYISDKIFCSS